MKSILTGLLAIGRRQFWIAGGIGVTPFLAWLESLQSRPTELNKVDLHYLHA